MSIQSRPTNRTDRPYTMYETVQGWAERTPDAPALMAKGCLPLTYGALAELADHLRRSLNYHGFGRNDRIAIVHPGGAEMAATIVGIWSCAAAAPMNPAYTVGEFAIYFRDLRANAVLVDATMDTPARQAARQLGLPILEIVHEDKRVAGKVTLRHGAERSVRDAGNAQLDDLATVLATSGTTSNSKIVPLRQRELWWKYANAARCLELTPEDRCLNLMPLFHGHGINTGLGVSLWSGGSIIILEQFEIDTFADYIQSLEPTWYTGVFTFHHHILAHAERLKAVIATSRVRFARSGSGPLDARVGKEIEEALAIPVIQNYSTTETGMIACSPLPPRRRKHGSVGLPVSDGVAIMDPDGEILPAGQRGEVVVRGNHVFGGYENDDDANDAAFIDGRFRTGDEGFFDEDGYLMLTGRIKEIISRGGEKITPAEIDEALLRHPEVAAAVTFPVPHTTLGQEIAAAVVPVKGAALTDKALARFLHGRLAPCKVPRRFVLVDDIPKGPTGKFERHKLAAAFGLDGGGGTRATTGDAGDAASASRAPSDLEARLSSLWASTLGCEHVGLHDDFFMLGGDSLQAVELFLRIEEDLGRRLPRTVLFESGTVAKMATTIEANHLAQCLVPIQPEGHKPNFFCVHGIDGDVLYFRDLARHLGNTQPFYGIRCHGLDGSATPSTSIPDMAARYLDEVQKVQPHGPYFIGGYSFGGWVAYEMACQLRRDGHDVNLLALIDTPCLNGKPGVPLSVRVAWAHRYMQASTGTGLDSDNIRQSIIGSLRLRVLSTAWRCGIAKRWLNARFRRYPMEAHGVAFRRYRPETLNGDAVLFHTEDAVMGRLSPYRGWNKLIEGKLSLRPVAGSHSEMMYEPNVSVLAQELANCLSGGDAVRQSRP